MGPCTGTCKVNCSLCSLQQVWWSLHCGLRQGWAGGLGSWDISSLWGFPEEGAALGNHIAQSSVSSVWVASPGHNMKHCKVKCSLCSVQQVWGSLHWVLQQGWAVALWGWRFWQY